MPFNFDQLVLGPCVDTFGEVNQGFPIPIYTPERGGQFNIDGVFDEAYKENVIRDGEIVTVTMPVLGVRASGMLIEGKQGDEVIVRGKTYTVREVRPDSHGHLKLMLNLAQEYQST